MKAQKTPSNNQSKFLVPSFSIFGGLFSICLLFLTHTLPPPILEPFSLVGPVLGPGNAKKNETLFLSLGGRVPWKDEPMNNELTYRNKCNIQRDYLGRVVVGGGK